MAQEIAITLAANEALKTAEPLLAEIGTIKTRLASIASQLAAAKTKIAACTYLPGRAVIETQLASKIDIAQSASDEL